MATEIPLALYRQCPPVCPSVKLRVHFISHIPFFYHPTTKCGGYVGFALSRRSVGRSVRPSVLLHYRVRSINPIPIEGFSSNLAVILTSLRGCAKPMLPLCQLKVTINGQISNSQMLDIMSYPLCKSYTN